MNNKKLYYILKSVWMVIILLVALVMMNRDFTELSQKKQKEEQAVRLNIALINEDVGVIRNGKVYSLGNDYVKKVEKDKTYNWYTVSRGIGENGLKSGTYNLLVTIPSNFSEKLLDLESTSPEQIQVNYKVNANGNQTLENESNNAGRKIVNGLNQQLVDMYVASIMDNLFTAQKNIEKVYHNQVDSVSGFQQVLYQPTLDFKQYLPSISTQSKSALQANDLLTNTLTTYTKSTDSLVSSHKEYSTDVEALLNQRADGKLMYEDFVKILLSMDESLLNSETNQLYHTLESKNNYLNEQLLADDSEYNYTALMDQLQQQLADTKIEIEQQSEKLATLKDQYFETYKPQFFQAFHLEPTAEQVTLKQALTLQGYNSTNLNSISTFNKKYTDWMNQRLGQLPYIGTVPEEDDYEEVFNYQLAPFSQSNPNEILTDLETALTSERGILNTIEAINQKNNASINPDVTPLQLPTLADATASPYYNSLKRAYDYLVSTRTGLFNTRNYFVIELEQYRGTTLTFVIPEGIEQVTIGGTSYSEKNVSHSWSLTGKKTYVYYTFDSEYDELATPAPAFQLGITFPVPVSTRSVVDPTVKVTPKQETTPDAEQASADSETAPNETTETTEEQNGAKDQSAPKTAVSPIVLAATGGKSVSWVQPADTTIFSSKNYQKAKSAYLKELGRVTELYRVVASELSLYQSYPLETMSSLLETPMTDVFKFVIDKVFFSSDGDYAKQEAQLKALNEKAMTIERQSDSLMRQLQAIQENTSQLNDTVTQQLPLLKEWQETMTKITNAENEVSKINQTTDADLTSAKATLDSLLTQTEIVKESSDMNVKEAESVKSVFDSFDKEVATAQKNGEDLSSNADVMLHDLTKELTKNRDFTTAFINVLSNAHKDGVLNNGFLQFIANPVTGKADAVIKTTEVNEPFTWILIMYTVSFFIAYLFATQPIFKRMRDTFKAENLRLKNNLLNTTLLTLSSLVSGFVIGLLSVGELNIIKESQIVWIMIVLLFTLLFALLNHYAIKQFKIAGFGVSLFLFISYIFATSALGKASTQNFLGQLVSHYNPLTIGENNLASVLGRENINRWQLLLYVLVVIALLLFNVFIWKPNQVEKEGVAK